MSDVSVRPNYRAPDAGDYHITLGSAAIDQGTDAGVQVDMDGEPRPQGNGFDIGADEFIDVIEGNKRYTKSLTVITKIDLVDEKKLKEIKQKIKPERFIIEWMSAAEGKKFADVVSSMSKIARTKPGMAYPIRITVDENTSK